MPLAALLAGLVATQVPEPPSAPAIAWHAPPGCPDAAALTRAVEQRLGRALADDELRLDAAISLHPAAPRFRLQLALTAAGRSQTRQRQHRRPAVDRSEPSLGPPIIKNGGTSIRTLSRTVGGRGDIYARRDETSRRRLAALVVGGPRAAGPVHPAAKIRLAAPPPDHAPVHGSRPPCRSAA